MDKHFANITKRIISNLPFWFNIKKDPNNSIGASFLDVFGVSLDEVKYAIDYAYKQTSLLTADESMIDISYKAIAPSLVSKNSENIKVIGDGFTLKRVSTVEEFFTRPSEGMNHPEMNPAHLYYLDEESMIIYTLLPFHKYPGSNELELTVEINNEYIQLPLNVHMVWNYFDEFGYLLACPRISGETNREYKERLLDIFENPPGASKEHLLNAISRELGLTRKVAVSNTNELTLNDPMIIVNQIKVDGRVLPLDNVTLLHDNRVQITGIKGNELPEAIYSNVVSYNAGIEIHRLNNKQDYSLHRQLFNSNLTPTELLKHYARTIQTLVPIMWGQFKFDEAYWDTASEEMLGYGCLPHISDASIEGFRWFTEDNPRNMSAPKLVEIISNDIETNLIGESSEINIVFSQILKDINTYPTELKLKGGDLIGLSYHGQNG